MSAHPEITSPPETKFLPVHGWIVTYSECQSFKYWCAPCRTWHGHGWDGDPSNRQRVGCPAIPSGTEILLDALGPAPDEIVRRIEIDRPPAGQRDPGKIITDEE